ncbi:MAG: response regulator [Hydrogenophilaceae bacterium]|nr:response regulator [Hydrogenophilaceae bacterium]
MNIHPLRQLLLNVGLGFAVAMLLLLGVIALAISQMAEVNQQLEKVVAVNNVKTRIATRMRDTLRDRAILMHDIVVSIDPWEKDALFQQFLSYGERYAKDRTQLIEMQESQWEKEVMSKLDDITRINSPVMFEVVSQALDQNNYGALTLLQEQAIPLQNRLVEALDELTQLQREANEMALRKAYDAYQSTRNFILVLGALAAVLAVIVAYAVSRRVASQTRLIETEKLKFQTLFESNSDAVVIMDDRGFIDCNPATLEMFRIDTTEEFLRTPITDLGASVQEGNEAALPYAMRHIEHARKNGHAFMEWMGRRMDGSLFPSEIGLHAMNLGGRPVIQAIMRDISERKENERALKEAHDQALSAARAKSEFIANVSHEIRTPLHGIMGMADLLIREPLTGIQRDYAQTLRQSAQGLRTVINDILDFSKLEAGKLQLESIPFSPQEVLQNVIDLFRPRMIEKSLDLVLDISPDLHVPIRGDPTRLRQILLNLLDNAIKFTERGSIHVRARQLDQNAYRIEVQDEGVGIPLEIQPKIFNAFSQADTSTTRLFGGTGLGLTICRQLVELMHGKIGLKSPPDGTSSGTLFWIELPFDKVPSDALSARPSPPTLKLFKGRVLIAEDNPVNQKVLTYQLGALGLETGIASTGREACERAANENWDLILMDWQMPEMDGFEATRHIRKMNGKSGQIPIIALSAQSGDDFRQRCHAAGMNDYLSKPYEEIALTSLLAKWLPARETGATAPLNLAKIAGNKPADSKQMREIGRVFEETTEALIDKLQSAFDSRDSLAGKRESHCLRGSAAAISADDLFKLATALETAFEHSDWKEAETLLDDTQAEYLRLRQYLHLHDQDN